MRAIRTHPNRSPSEAPLRAIRERRINKAQATG